MVDWVQRTGGVVPTQRIEPSVRRSRASTCAVDGDGETKRGWRPSLFSGSPEADERARAFDEHADCDDDLVSRPNGPVRVCDS